MTATYVARRPSKTLLKLNRCNGDLRNVLFRGNRIMILIGLVGYGTDGSKWKQTTNHIRDLSLSPSMRLGSQGLKILAHDHEMGTNVNEFIIRRESAIVWLPLFLMLIWLVSSRLVPLAQRQSLER